MSASSQPPIETDPRQLEHVNTLAAEFRVTRLPGDMDLCRLHGIGRGLRRLGHAHRHARFSAEHQGRRPDAASSTMRLEIDPVRDIIVNKRMASAFFETNLGSLFNFHGVDTVVVTGGSTSGCVRATVVDSPVAQLPHHRSRGMRRGQAREPSFRQPLRHGIEVRRRADHGRDARAVEAVAPHGGRRPCRRPPLKRDPGLYDYLPWNDRPEIRWPDDARVAFWVAPNIEFYELNPPRNPARAPWAPPIARHPELLPIGTTATGWASGACSTR